MKKIILLFFFMFIQAISAQTKDSVANDWNILIEKAEKIVKLLKNKDFIELNNFVSKINGLNFSPFTHEKLKINHFKKEKISDFYNIDSLITWGVYDGSGFPIELTPKDYYSKFIYDIDYHNKGKIIPIINDSCVNLYYLNSVKEFYKNGEIILYHYKGNKEIGFKDSKSLILIFEYINGNWFLVGVTHTEANI